MNLPWNMKKYLQHHLFRHILVAARWYHWRRRPHMNNYGKPHPDEEENHKIITQLRHPLQILLKSKSNLFLLNHPLNLLKPAINVNHDSLVSKPLTNISKQNYQTLSHLEIPPINFILLSKLIQNLLKWKIKGIKFIIKKD